MISFRAPLEILADPLPQTIMTSFTSASELMSALADGQLRDDELVDAWQVIEQADEAVASWSRYHLIGDLLRAPVAASLPTASRVDATSFVNRLNLKLHAEVTHVESLGASVRPALLAADLHTPQHQRQVASREAAANDGVFRWKLLAGFASLTAVSVITWAAVGQAGVSPTSPQLAQGGGAQQLLVVSPQGVMVRDARLNELLAAHKQLGSMSALQAPSGFLQSAAFEVSPGSGR